MSDLFLSDTLTITKEKPKTKERKEKRKENANVELDFLSVDHKAKELLSQVDFVGTHRRTEYIAELLNLQFHKSVAVRRKVATVLGLIAGQDLVNDLQTWLLHESDKDTYLVVDSTIERLSRKLGGNENQHSGVVFTVSEAIKAIKLRVSEKVFTVEGELGDVRAFGSMYYFTIKDKDETSIVCQCYGGKVASFGFPLNEGWSVRIEGKFKVDKQSKLKFEVEAMWLTGDGELLRKLQELELQLQSEGLFDEGRKRKINTAPTRILLIASPNSAAIDDFQKVLGERRRGITIFYLPIKTQGVGAEYDILSKLEIANIMCDKYNIDTVVLTRGGGSKEDLMVFNSQKIVRAIYALNKPSIVAIGHERDECLSEKVADLRASTPSNAAELCSNSYSELSDELSSLKYFITNYFNAKKARYQDFMDLIIAGILQFNKNKINENLKLCSNIDNLVRSRFVIIKNEINRNYFGIKNIVTSRLNQAQYSLQYYSRLDSNFVPRISNYNQQVNFAFTNIQSLVSRSIFESKSILNTTFEAISLYDTKKILNLGYSIVIQDGQSVEIASEFDNTKKTILRFKDGEAEI